MIAEDFKCGCDVQPCDIHTPEWFAAVHGRAAPPLDEDCPKCGQPRGKHLVPWNVNPVVDPDKVVCPVAAQPADAGIQRIRLCRDTGFMVEDGNCPEHGNAKYCAAEFVRVAAHPSGSEPVLEELFRTIGRRLADISLEWPRSKSACLEIVEHCDAIQRRAAAALDEVAARQAGGIMTLSELAQQWRDQTDGQSTGWLLATLQHARELEAWIAAHPAAQDTLRLDWLEQNVEDIRLTSGLQLWNCSTFVWKLRRCIDAEMGAAISQPLPASTPEES